MRRYVVRRVEMAAGRPEDPDFAWVSMIGSRAWCADRGRGA
jgi:hypothetical protein